MSRFRIWPQSSPGGAASSRPARCSVSMPPRFSTKDGAIWVAAVLVAPVAHPVPRVLPAKCA
eukprot:13499073-Alexandrium_andersonii.AAC.1